ncbi:MAG: 4-hydroxythreonine-4-phosphate dehydrogenase PdxA [Spirochaetae bacterium HGW-Spirochaetae-6]|nr:MAG: 4-hydroxythreonine-4-phosphate dehydrogenase PdxA [Spirochaetae bacterium HGW-Spirochaetae-6]
MSSQEKTTILFTAGDPGGVGYEILLKAVPQLKKANLLPKILFLVNEGALAYWAKKLSCETSLSELRIRAVGDRGFVPRVGEDHAENGKVALACLKEAVRELKEHSCPYLVTGPISKKAIVLAGEKGFTGHTTFLARQFGVEQYTMVLANPDFAVALVTIHHALKDVPKLVTREQIRYTIDNFYRFMQSKREQETIWVCALNPHAGEGGELGLEERDVIVPCLKELKKEGYPVEGPFPADALFKKAARKTGRYFVGMYHDQGLIPVKMLGENQTVNITLGLPFYRISVEHGTAYDIAGKNQADPASLLAAFANISG